MKKRSTHTRGYTLMEMLAVIALLAVGINLCMSIFISASRLSALSTQTLDRIGGIAEIEQTFVDAVRASCDVVPKAGRFATNDTCVALRMPSQDGAARYRVIGEHKQTHTLAFIELEERDGKFEEITHKNLRLPIEDVHIGRGENGADPARAVTLHFAIKLDRGERAARKTVHSVTAAARAIAPEKGGNGK